MRFNHFSFEFVSNNREYNNQLKYNIPIIPDPMIELMKLKDAVIIEFIDSREAFSGEINASLSPSFP